MIPRWYQLGAAKAAYDYFMTQPGNTCIALPTGTGKSYVIAIFIQAILINFPRTKILLATCSKELVKQDRDELQKLIPQIKIGICSAGLKKRETRESVVFGTIGTMVNADLRDFHIMIIDEAHTVSTSELSRYQKLLSKLRLYNQNFRVLGLTATPFRMGQGKLTDNGIFDSICYDKTNFLDFNKFIEEGHICKLITKKASFQIDTRNISITKGDFAAGELQEVCDNDVTNTRALEEVISYGHDRQHWLLFCAGIDHAENICIKLQEQGISATFIHSKLKVKELDQRISDYKEGKYQALCTNGMLTVGFNFKHIDLLVFLRPTCSVVLWLQMNGRGLRTVEGKNNCLAMDFVGNTERLGPINDPTLPRPKGQAPGIPPIKICPECDTYNHCSNRFCDGCGEEFTFFDPIVPEASNLDLIKEFKEAEIIEYPVNFVVYYEHLKLGSPPSIKVNYQCGGLVFSEYVCLEHSIGARHLASKWWMQRSVLPMPSTTKDALKLTHLFAFPKSIFVDVSGKYPKIMNWRF